MANKSKAKGTRAESRVVKYLQEHGFPHAKRIALHGNKDQGDVELGNGCHIIEVKAGEQARNPSRALFKSWLDQAEEERKNNPECSCCVLCIVEPGKQLKDVKVYEPYSCSATMWFFDDWVDEVRSLDIYSF